ncbi:hypothetical protein CDD81_3818 [Ophiocordyceps australis]|uniref:Uncharacterized protein n=1 Tax=Ophiocordyceps australis TaxID=1399860 RepID=A0A2C5X746_9HYPO|nr:hypothetical protein CDD81_3818 [Ophiocordyceps australis]
MRHAIDSQVASCLGSIGALNTTAPGPLASSMSHPNQPKRRFAPVPVETSFQSVRASARQPLSVGPNAEPTPEPSPRWPSPPTIPEPRLRRRFKPQLVETSRRTHRAGDAGPATKPSDKTDITPYTNHIYATKPRLRRKRSDSLNDESLVHMPPTRRETEEEGGQEYLLQLAAKHIQEVALAAFPNSRAREGGVAHFYYCESSDSDKSSHDNESLRRPWQLRRKSSNLGFNWWHKHMQEHAESLAQQDNHDAHGDILMRSDSDLDKMYLPVPPNPLWTTTTTRNPDALDSSTLYPLALESSHALQHNAPRSSSRHPPQPFQPLASLCSASNADAHSPRPFGAFALPPEDPKLHLMQKAASPPMLGKDLTFRKCPSPKQTKLETDHPFSRDGQAAQKNRDVTGQGGLWKGYCCRSESDDNCIVPAELHGADMIVTPQPPGSPHELCGFDSSSTSASSDSSGTTFGLWSTERRSRSGQPKGLHMLHGLDERLRREKAQAERDEKIVQEFNDDFITQVYNYLSLGYPATAHTFDEELSKISRVSMQDLGRDDETRMAKGYMLESNFDDVAEDDRCPRWRALKIYIMEWARQHPNLDSLDPLAWGVRERRGSWAI